MCALTEANVKPGPPPVAAPERSDGAATGGRAEALVGRFVCLANQSWSVPGFGGLSPVLLLLSPLA
jgi:hypothetical protein